MGSTVSSPNVKCLTSSTRFLCFVFFFFFCRRCPESFPTHLVNTPSSTLRLNNYMFLELQGGDGGAAAPLVISRKINIFAYCPKRDHANLQKKLFLLGGGGFCVSCFQLGPAEMKRRRLPEPRGNKPSQITWFWKALKAEHESFSRII